MEKNRTTTGVSGGTKVYIFGKVSLLGVQKFQNQPYKVTNNFILFYIYDLQIPEINKDMDSGQEIRASSGPGCFLIMSPFRNITEKR